jgi:hypothetical protein
MTQRQIKITIAVIALAMLGLLLLLPGGAKGATTIIHSLPYPATQAGTAYSETLMVSGGNLVGTGSGITITGHDIVLNLGGDTITYNTSRGNSYGITFSGNPYNIKIIGGWIIDKCAPTYDSISSAKYDTCGSGAPIYFSGGSPRNITILNTNLIVAGKGEMATPTHCIYSPGITSDNVLFDHVRMWDYSPWFGQRDHYLGFAVNIKAVATGSETNLRFRNCRIFIAPGGGIVTQGNGPTYLCRSEVVGCTISVDQRNIQWPCPSGDIMHGSGNAYDILLQRVASGTRADSNYLYSGTLYGGSEGICIEGGIGTLANPIFIRWNTIDIHEGFDDYGYCTGYGIKERYYNANVNSPNNVPGYYIYILNNNIIVTANSAGDPCGFTAYSDNVVGIAPCMSDAANPNISPRDGTGMRIENNHVVAYNVGAMGAYASALSLDGGVGLGDTTLYIFRNNYWESDAYPICMAGANNGSQNMLLSGDTVVVRQSTKQSFASTYTAIYPNMCGAGTNAWGSSGDVFLDMVYGASTSDTNINLTMVTNNQTISLKRTIYVHVIGSDNQPVVGATVTIKNAYNATVLSLTTNAYGIASGIVTYWFESNNLTDSTTFNPFSIKAKKLTDSTTVTGKTVAWNAYTFYDTLHATGGTAPPSVDSLSWARIDSGRCDYAGELDSVWLVYHTGSTTGDTVIGYISTSAYPSDTTGSNRRAKVFSPDKTDSLLFTLSMTESCSLYAKIYNTQNYTPRWWSQPKIASRYFVTGYVSPGPSAHTPDTLAQCRADSIQCDKSGEKDTFEVVWTAMPDSADSVIIAWAAGGYPDSAWTQRTAAYFKMSLADSTGITISLTEPARLYLSFWTKVNAAIPYWSPRQQRTIYLNQAPIPRHYKKIKGMKPRR